MKQMEPLECVLIFFCNGNGHRLSILNRRIKWNFQTTLINLTRK